MSAKHPIISVTGSSGAGTSTVRHTFEQIFRREKVKAAFIEGDAFHRYDRAGMKAAMAEAARKGDNNFSHFGPEANLLEDLEQVFRQYAEFGTGRTRHYVHDAEEAEIDGVEPGAFSAWEEFPAGTDLLFYEGLHGAVVTDGVDIARYADLKIGVVPVINLEWIQKIHRDKAARGYSTDAVTDTILRRMPDYVQLHLSPVHADRHQFPACADGRYVEPVHRPLDPDAGRVDGRDPLPQPARDRFPLSRLDDPQQLHVAGELHRHSRRQARSRHAAHPDAAHPQARRAAAARRLSPRGSRSA